jgi:hypothetical protein
MARITRYQLPPDFTKATDTRRAAFVATYDDVTVDLASSEISWRLSKHDLEDWKYWEGSSVPAAAAACNQTRSCRKIA